MGFGDNQTTTNRPKVVLKKKYSARLEYRTVWVDDNGYLHFGEDIYWHDKRQLERLDQISSMNEVVVLL